MEKTTSFYNPYASARRVNLKFIFGVIAPEAAAQAVPESSVQSVVSQIEQTHNSKYKMGKKYGTLEDNLFILDGTYACYEDDLTGSQTGFVSAVMSDANRQFSSNPWIEFAFGKSQRSYAFTLVFDDGIPDDYPQTVITTTYDKNGAVIGSITTYPNSSEHIIPMPTNGYRKVRFQFSGTVKPYRRIRLCQAIFGIRYEYSGKAITSASINMSASPYAQTLPSNELEATINNANQLYNMINPAGLFAYLQNGQFAECAITIDGEDINMGRYYFTSSQSEDGGLTARITFHDRMLMLDNSKFMGGSTGTWTLGEAVSSILSAAGFDIKINYADGVGGTIINRCIPQDTTSREALRLACQAARCTCYIDRDFILQFFKPKINRDVDEITRDNMINDAQIKVDRIYNTVALSVKNEYDESSQEVIYTAKNVEEDDTELIYQLNNPLAYDGNAVAEWVLHYIQRVMYNINYRGNPALDIFDTVKIHDIYGVNGSAMVTEQQFNFDGGLSANIQALK